MRTFNILLSIAVASMAGCSTDPADADTPTAPSSIPADELCTGTAAARGEALRTRIESAEDGTTVRLGPCQYYVAESVRDDYDSWSDTLYNSGIVITDKAGLTITGAGRGRTTVQFARPVYIGFEIRSNTVGLTISDMTIAGSIMQPLCAESPDLQHCHGGRFSSRPGTHAIASTGHTRGVDDITIARVEIHDVAVGISVGAPWGSYGSALIEDNYLHDIRGTYSGTGYGIHVGCANGVLARNNVIARAGRHSVYIACTSSTSTDPLVFMRNTIIDHGHAEAMDERAAALVIARSDNVSVIDNTLIGGHTYGISAEFDATTTKDCTRCLIAGNRFLRAGSLEDIWITARSPVWTWANIRDRLQPARVRDESGMQVDVAGPGKYWSGTQALSTMPDPAGGDDYILVMQNEYLHVLKPEHGVSPEIGWREHRHSTTRWTGFVGMSADQRHVYVLQDDLLHAVTPEWTDGWWQHTFSAGWYGATAITTRDEGFVYVTKDGTLHRVDPISGQAMQWEMTWDPALGLGWGEHSLYASAANAVYELEIDINSVAAPARPVD